ncbi:MAG: lysoplasmalogenase family protein [Bulleidia sp.]
MNRVLAIIAGSFFLLAGIYDCYDDERHGKRRLKPFLMPLLTVFYLTSADHISPLAASGLLLGGLGDTLLIHKQNQKALLGGTAAFLGGHLCYVLRFVQDLRIGVFPEWTAAVLFGYGVYAAVFAPRLLKHAEKRLKPPVIAYMIGLLAMSMLAFLRFSTGEDTGRLLVWLGSLCFVVSDTILAFSIFAKGSHRGVMETYLAAQTLITIGFLHA